MTEPELLEATIVLHDGREEPLVVAATKLPDGQVHVVGHSRPINLPPRAYLKFTLPAGMTGGVQIISDDGRDDWVLVRCRTCGADGLVPPEALYGPDGEPLLDINADGVPLGVCPACGPDPEQPLAEGAPTAAQLRDAAQLLSFEPGRRRVVELRDAVHRQDWSTAWRLVHEAEQARRRRT